MNKTILKFPLEFTEEQTILVPKDATFLSVQMQKDKLCLWAECVVNSDLEKRTVEILGTSHIFEFAARKYISTVQDGIFVWHIYELIT
ncbi:MAG: hypothetical protein E4H07_04955 [Nitrosomonadales bacterium]|nr:MAG: hypothetical protein E4H07_04955 [Nitrosomonadales bacterium]